MKKTTRIKVEKVIQEQMAYTIHRFACGDMELPHLIGRISDNALLLRLLYESESEDKI